MTAVLERSVDAGSKLAPVSTGAEGGPAAFNDFDPSLEAAVQAARPTGAPILILTSSRLDGSKTCSEH